jgi:Fe-S-cluster-containing dehydrogenase component
MNTSGLRNRSTTIKHFLIYSEKCTACMSCVLTCSLHHGKSFDRKMASIEVSTSKKEREIHVFIQKGQQGDRPTCDTVGKEQKSPFVLSIVLLKH